MQDLVGDNYDPDPIVAYEEDQARRREKVYVHFNPTARCLVDHAFRTEESMRRYQEEHPDDLDLLLLPDPLLDLDQLSLHVRSQQDVFI